MDNILKWIGSGKYFYHVGIYFGIALTIISLWVADNFHFDWMLVFFVGLAIFFFFMGIQMNTDEFVIKKEEVIDPNTGLKNQNTTSSYQTYLDHFNVLSRAGFCIAGAFAFLASLRMLWMVVF